MIFNQTTSRIIFAIVISAGITACQKSKDIRGADADLQQESVRITNLVEKMYSESDAAQDEAVWKEYHAMTDEQFALFEKIRDNRDSLSLISKGMNKQALDADIAMSRKLRNKIKQLSKEEFGVSAHTLGKQQFSQLIKVLQEKSGKRDKTSRASAAGVCPAWPGFDGTSGYVYNYSGIFYYNVENAGNDWTDLPCDGNYKFDGHYNRHSGANQIDRNIIDESLGLWYQYYSDGFDTFTLVGGISIHWYYWSKSQLNMRMF